MVLCLFPAWCFGSAWCFAKEEIKEQHTEKYHFGSWLTSGMLFFLAGFEIITIVSKLRGWSLNRLTMLGLAYEAGLTAVFLLLLFKKSFRRYFLSGIKGLFGPSNRSVWFAGICCYGLIALLYLVRGFRLETYHTLPEDASMVLGSGFLLSEADLPVLYAFLARMTFLRIEQVMFMVMPYVWLLVFTAAFFHAVAYFTRKKSDFCLLMIVYTLLVLFADTSHMNLPYMIIHAPYEGDAILGGFLAFQIFSVFLSSLYESRRKGRLLAVCELLMAVVTACLLGNLKTGIILAGMEMVLLSACAIVYRYMNRRKES